MDMLLGSGYPYPLPDNFNSDETYDPRDHSLALKDIAMIEWLHTLTVEFVSEEAYVAAKALTEWPDWSAEEFILEATVSEADGYQHPAIIVKDTAYCGFVLVEY